jgi:hypothetical protein
MISLFLAGPDSGGNDPFLIHGEMSNPSDPHPPPPDGIGEALRY